MLEPERHQWHHSELGESCQRVLFNLPNGHDHSQEVRISKIVSSQWYMSEIVRDTEPELKPFKRNSRACRACISQFSWRFLDRICTMWVKPLLKSAKVYMLTMVTCRLKCHIPTVWRFRKKKNNDTVEIIATTCWWIFLTQKSSWFWGVLAQF